MTSMADVRPIDEYEPPTDDTDPRLIGFLRNRYEETWRIAVAACGGGKGVWAQADPDRYEGRIVNDRGEVVTHDEGAPHEHEARHIAANDPARVLADINAKRRILELYREERTRRDIYESDEARAEEDDEQATRRRSAAARTRGLEMAIEILALPYALHPDYDEEWRLGGP
jgi:hypothetical protein